MVNAKKIYRKEDIQAMSNKPVNAVDGMPDCSEVSLSSGLCEDVSIVGSLITIHLSGANPNSCLSVAVNGIRDMNGLALTGDNDVHVKVVLGEVNSAGSGDRRASAFQVGVVRSHRLQGCAGSLRKSAGYT